MKFQFPTITEIKTSFIDTLKRFPFVLIFLFILTVYTIYITHSDITKSLVTFNIIQTLILGAILSVGISTFFESNQSACKTKLLYNFILVFLLVGYYFLLPKADMDKNIFRGLFLIVIAFIASIASPYFKKNKQQDFWFYNFSVLQRFTTTVIYSAVIYIGVAIALLIIDNLFKAEINEKLYFDIFMAISGTFAPIFFFAGYPKKYYLDENETIDYPKPTRIFVQYILLPLVTLYFLIVYIYFAQVVILWQIPQNIISTLVIIFSAIGILSLMLIFPIQKDEKYKFINFFSKYFYVAIIPLIILLFISIYERIAQYGITENRYFIIALAIWLIGLSVYMVISKQKNIKIITLSFAVVLLISTYGPINAFVTSKNNQLKVLDKLLIENNIIKDGKILPNTKQIEDSIYYRIESVSRYIIENHGIAELNKKYDLELSDTIDRWSSMSAFLDTLNLSYSNTYNYEKEDYFYYTYEPKFSDLTQWEYLYNYSTNYVLDTINFVLPNNDNFQIKNSEFKMCIFLNKEIYCFDLKEYERELSPKYSTNYANIITETEATKMVELEKYKLKLIFNYIEGYYYPENDTLIINNLNVDIYIKKK